MSSFHNTIPLELLVRFLWAYKENEQQHGKHKLTMITQSNYLSTVNGKYLDYLCIHNRTLRDTGFVGPSDLRNKSFFISSIITANYSTIYLFL